MEKRSLLQICVNKHNNRAFRGVDMSKSENWAEKLEKTKPAAVKRLLMFLRKGAPNKAERVKKKEKRDLEQRPRSRGLN